MEENLKLYSQKAIAIATYLGSPLAAGILIRQNCINLGRERQGLNALMIGIISTILMFIGIFAIPEYIIDKVPNALIPLIYTVIIYIIVERIQGEDLKNHKKNQGEFYSSWKAAGIGGISAVILTAGIFAYVYAVEDDIDFDVQTYDQEIEKFIENESQALKFFNEIETANEGYLLLELTKGIGIWKENTAIVDRINTIENLPIELFEQNVNLKKYCTYRIEQYELFMKAIIENTDKYNLELEEIGLKIEQILIELD